MRISDLVDIFLTAADLGQSRQGRLWSPEVRRGWGVHPFLCDDSRGVIRLRIADSRVFGAGAVSCFMGRVLPYSYCAAGCSGRPAGSAARIVKDRTMERGFGGWCELARIVGWGVGKPTGGTPVPHWTCAGVGARSVRQPNAKFEARNPKQIPMTEYLMIETRCRTGGKEGEEDLTTNCTKHTKMGGLESGITGSARHQPGECGDSLAKHRSDSIDAAQSLVLNVSGKPFEPRQAGAWRSQ